ncbi:DNA primase [Saccharicrinis aurantiacus]|uniref:DNA primase n=1 Tax=Saccharicrinis aurantiacus TaxID=1849719 RepID=UPI002492B545|nr:DNA primase [Saccharicrinis aurantiacus]
MDANRVIEQINDHILKVVDNYIKLNKAGSNYKACCPFHNEKTASFSVNPAKGIFKCFGCDRGGNAIEFIKQQEGVDFKEAVEIGAKILKVSFEWKKSINFDEAKYKHEESLKVACNIIERFFLEQVNNKEAKSYIKERNLAIPESGSFNIGYAPNNNALLVYARTNGLKTEILEEIGVLKSSDNGLYDFFRNRLIFPVSNSKGQTIAFAGRDLDKIPKIKYLNTLESSIYIKGNELYALNVARFAIQKNDMAYIVEGYSDVLRMHDIGIENTVATCGTALTQAQAKLLKRYTNKVTLIFDGDAAGLLATDRNAEILIKNEFHVSVILLPEKQDPDSTFTTKADFLQYAETQSDYLIYKTGFYSDKFANDPVKKSEVIKRISSLISCYDKTKQEVYLDFVAELIKPKKAWQDALKTNNQPSEKKLKKKENISDIIKLKKEQQENLLENQFYEENGAYYTMEGKNPKQISNFTFEAIFCVFHKDPQGKLDLKYVLRLISQYGRKRLAIISSDDFCTPASFKKQVHRRHGFFWYGNDSQLDNIKNVKLLGIPEAKELERVGFDEINKFWVFANGLYYNKNFHPIDEYGISTHTTQINNMDEFDKIPPESQIRIKDTFHVLNTTSEFIGRYGKKKLESCIDKCQVHLLHFFYLPYGKSLKIGSSDGGNPFKENSKYVKPIKGSSWSFAQWAKSMTKVYPGNSELLIAYYIATIFSDLIYRANFGYFPILFLFGKRQSGKSTAARSIMYMFGKPPMEDGINLASGSTSTGMQRSMDSTTNHPFWGNEYKNSIHKNTIEALKGISDRNGKLTGVKSGGNETKIARPRGSGIISGQDLPTQDPALSSRSLLGEFDDNNRGNYSDLKLFKSAEESLQFTNITCAVFDYRYLIEEYYSKIEPEISSEVMDDLVREYGNVDRRTVLNISSVLTPMKILMEYSDLGFPFDFLTAKNALTRSAKLTISVQNQSDEVEQYFHVLQSLLNLYKISENTHYKMEAAENNEKHLYLRVGAIHGLYREQARKEGITVLDQAVIGEYLKKHRSFIDYRRKNVKFGSNRTSAYIMNYDTLKDQGIELERFSI